MDWADFVKTVERVVRAIPLGETLSYAQVALRAGRPGGARAASRAMRFVSQVPWWRVVRSDWTLAEEVAEEQAKLLRREGHVIAGRRLARKTTPSPAGRQPKPRTRRSGRRP